jgi:hypothetical protein
MPAPIQLVQLLATLLRRLCCCQQRPSTVYGCIACHICMCVLLQITTTSIVFIDATVPTSLGYNYCCDVSLCVLVRLNPQKPQERFHNSLHALKHIIMHRSASGIGLLYMDCKVIVDYYFPSIDTCICHFSRWSLCMNLALAFGHICSVIMHGKNSSSPQTPSVFWHFVRASRPQWHVTLLWCDCVRRPLPQ